MPIQIIFLCFLAAVFACVGQWRRSANVRQHDQAALMYIFSAAILFLGLLYYPEISSPLLQLGWWTITIAIFLSATSAAVYAWQAED